MKSDKLALKKQELKLKMKEQELDIRVSLLKVRQSYSPVNLASNVAVQLFGNQTDEEGKPLLDAQKLQTSKHIRKASDVVYNLLALADAYLADATDKVVKQKALGESDKYVIGKDDK